MADPHTDMGTGGRTFPLTHWSIIREAKEGSRKSLEDLASIYWRPVYAYFRSRWKKSNEEAKDLTQEFFLGMTVKDFLKKPSPEFGRFRSYIMTSLDNFARLQHRHDSAKKRGGGATRLSIDFGEGFEPAGGETPDRVFLREWAGSVLDEALQEMEKEYRSRGLGTVFDMFRQRDVESPPEEDNSYEALASRFRFTVTDVRNYLHRARKRLRELVLLKVRDTVSSPEEAEHEMKELFREMF